jgi:hypothetical protein
VAKNFGTSNALLYVHIQRTYLIIKITVTFSPIMINKYELSGLTAPYGSKITKVV